MIIHHLPLRKDSLDLCAIIERCTISQNCPVANQKPKGDRNEEFRIGGDSKQGLESAICG